MKYIERFDYTIGDYVKFRNMYNSIMGYNVSDKLIYFLNNNVGTINSKEMGPNGVFYYVKYNNIPEDIKDFFQWRPFDKDINYKLIALYKKEIRLATKEEIEEQLIKNNVNKYNL